MLMSNQPRPDDAVLGGNSFDISTSAVLGGTAGIMVHHLRVTGLEAQMEFARLQWESCKLQLVGLKYYQPEFGLLGALSLHYQGEFHKLSSLWFEASHQKLNYEWGQINSRK